jgi:hypothetical protein
MAVFYRAGDCRRQACAPAFCAGAWFDALVIVAVAGKFPQSAAGRRHVARSRVADLR